MPAAFTYHARKSLVRWHRPTLPTQVKLAGPHKLGCLLLPLPPDAAKELNDWCLEAVPDWWLGPGGRELSPHVTVLYGFTQDTPEQLAALRAFLAREGPCRIGLGGLDAFPGGKDGVPLFLHVDGPQLEDMNYNLRETFPAEVKFPNYVPHVCVAYLDPQFVELAKRLDCPLAGRELTLGTAVYSNPAGDKTEIPLSLLPPLWGTKAQPAPAAAGNEPKASGTRKDSLGRERCYQDGKLVPCNKPEETDANDNNSGVGESQAPGRTRLTDAELLTDQQQPGQQPQAEPAQDTSDPQFQREWAAEVEKQLAEIEQANVAAYEYSPQEIAAEQNWHSEFIQWRWGLKMPGADGQEQLLAIKPADVGPAARFISGLLNPLLGGAAYVAGLLDKLAGRPPKSKTESEVGKQLQVYFDALNPDSSANAPAAELAAAVLGPQALPIAKQLISLPATGEQRKLSDKAKVPTPAELEAAGAPDDVKIRAAADPEYARRWADKQRRIKVQQNRAKKKQEKQDALDPEERQTQQEQEKAKLAERRAKQEARGVQQRAVQEKQDRRFAAVKDRLTDAELERWWQMPPGERNRFLASKERENKVAVPKSRIGNGLLGYAAKALPSNPIKVHLPDLEQHKDWSCGASCMQIICTYFGVGPQEEAAFRKLLGSTPSQGTNVARIIAFAKEQGLQVDVRDHRTVDELKPLLDAGRPVLVLLQAWGYPRTYRDDGSGHYAIVIGYDDEYVYFEDPWIKGRRARLKTAEFDRRWHDAGAGDESDGPTRYVRWGMSCWRPTKVVSLKQYPNVERIPGGLAAGRPDSAFDPEQLAAGIEVELEHTSDPAVAKEIAKDHLMEDPRYYVKLRRLEDKALSALNETAGGALVPPARQAGSPLPPSRVRRRGGRVLLDVLRKTLSSYPCKSEGESYFASCPRDDQGHCKPSGEAGESGPERENTPEEKPLREEVHGEQDEGGKQERSRKRIDDVLEQAETIKFSDAFIDNTEEIDSNDWGGIESRMSQDEKEEMETQLEEWRDEYISERLSEFEPEIDEDELAQDNGFSDEDVRDKALELVDEWLESKEETDNEAAEEEDWEETAGELREAIESWHSGTSKSGVYAVREMIRDTRRKAGLPDGLDDLFNAYESEVEESIEKLVEEAKEEQEQAERERLEQNYDDGDDRIEYLRNFYRQNEERYAATESDEGCGEKVWCRDRDNDDVLKFKTSAGNTYEVFSHKGPTQRTFNGKRIPDIQFRDQAGSFDITGSGSAFEVFSNVVPAVIAYVKKNDSDVVTFSAKGKSRQKLYDRLVKTVLAAMPDYFGASEDKGETRYYVVGKRALRSQLEEKFKTKSAPLPGEPGEPPPLPLRNPAEIEPEADPDWWERESWEEERMRRGLRIELPPSRIQRRVKRRRI